MSDKERIDNLEDRNEALKPWVVAMTSQIAALSDLLVKNGVVDEQELERMMLVRQQELLEG